MLTSPSPTASLADDVYYAAAWAEANHILVNDQDGKPVDLLTPASVNACVNTAVATLVSSGSDLRSLWTIDDLLAVDNFRRIADSCSDFDTLSVLFAVAHDWAKLPPVHMVQFEEVFHSKILF